LRTLYHPVARSEVLDSAALVLYFPSSKTVTGEDVLELHIHGGPATVKAVLSSIPNCPSNLNIRYAEPGEFTRRAFQNDRLDLAQIEALSDTLSAETEQQRRAAVRGNSGKLGRTYEEWRQQLLYARGELEALIDFSEDQYFEETPAELLGNVTAQVKVMLNAISTHIVAGQRGELLKKGIRIALLGPPNAGKSSLLNQIVGREASIVSREAGTTRDIVEISLDIQGYLCTLADTAGLRSHDARQKEGTPPHLEIGEVEMEGMRRARENAANADLVIALAYLNELAEDEFEVVWDKEAFEIASKASQSIFVINKVDQDLKGERLTRAALESLPKFQTDVQSSDIPIVLISCRDAQSGAQDASTIVDRGNIKHLVTSLVNIFKTMTDLPKDMEDLIGVTERQRQLLSTCTDDLNLFIDEARHSDEGEADIVLAAEHLRSAANCLSRITGRGEAGDVEEVLGVVFEKYLSLINYFRTFTNDNQILRRQMKYHSGIASIFYVYVCMPKD
jgi:tRNA modification GTPase